jgi:ribosomal subunit interface protein
VVTDAIREYVEHHFKTIERFVPRGESRELVVTVSKETGHHREGEFRAEAQIKLRSQDFFAAQNDSDLMRALDLVKDDLVREITSAKGKRMALFHRGARTLKRVLKNGLGFKK